MNWNNSLIKMTKGNYQGYESIKDINVSRIWHYQGKESVKCHQQICNPCYFDCWLKSADWTYMAFLGQCIVIYLEPLTSTTIWNMSLTLWCILWNVYTVTNHVFTFICYKHTQCVAGIWHFLWLHRKRSHNVHGVRSSFTL